MSSTTESLLRSTMTSNAPILALANVTIAPVEPCTRISLRLRTSSATPLDLELLGLETPINTCVTVDGRISARVAPDEWLLFDSHASPERVIYEYSTALPNWTASSLVDISHRDAGIIISGTHARDVITAGCPMDLDDRRFPPYSATRTRIGKIEIVLIRTGTERRFRLECARSLAPYLYDLLSEAAQA